MLARDAGSRPKQGTAFKNVIVTIVRNRPPVFNLPTVTLPILNVDQTSISYRIAATDPDTVVGTVIWLICPNFFLVAPSTCMGLTFAWRLTVIAFPAHSTSFSLNFLNLQQWNVLHSESECFACGRNTFRSPWYDPWRLTGRKTSWSSISFFYVADVPGFKTTLLQQTRTLWWALWSDWSVPTVCFGRCTTVQHCYNIPWHCCGHCTLTDLSQLLALADVPLFKQHYCDRHWHLNFIFPKLLWSTIVECILNSESKFYL